MQFINTKYATTAKLHLRAKSRCHQCSIQMGSKVRRHIYKHICALIIMFAAGSPIGSAQSIIAESLNVHIYSTEPHKLVGVSRLKQEPLTVRIIDLAIIPKSEALFNTYINNGMPQQSVAEIKALIEQTPRDQLQKLANAQLSLFDLQTRYDVGIEDLPVTIFATNKSFYLYQGNDVYQGFLLWQQLKK